MALDEITAAMRRIHVAAHYGYPLTGCPLCAALEARAVLAMQEEAGFSDRNRRMQDAPNLSAALRYMRADRPCPCDCNSGGFCGGCGHAGCGRR